MVVSNQAWDIGTTVLTGETVAITQCQAGPWPSSYLMILPRSLAEPLQLFSRECTSTFQHEYKTALAFGRQFGNSCCALMEFLREKC